jgi:hypothetical protein
LHIPIIKCYICATLGGLAHLARVLAWQARGDRFESGILHKNPNFVWVFLCLVLKKVNYEKSGLFFIAMNYFYKNSNNSYLAPTEGKILLSRLVPKDETKDWNNGGNDIG